MPKKKMDEGGVVDEVETELVLDENMTDILDIPTDVELFEERDKGVEMAPCPVVAIPVEGDDEACDEFLRAMALFLSRVRVEAMLVSANLINQSWAKSQRQPEPEVEVDDDMSIPLAKPPVEAVTVSRRSLKDLHPQKKHYEYELKLKIGRINRQQGMFNHAPVFEKALNLQYEIHNRVKERKARWQFVNAFSDAKILPKELPYIGAKKSKVVTRGVKKFL